MTDSKLTYPTCVVCGNAWSSIEGEHLRDDKTMWCCQGHDTIWYYQYKDGSASFNRKVNNLYGSDYEVCWNCSCMEESCAGKNIIRSIDIDDEGEILREFDPPLPFTITREELYSLIAPGNCGKNTESYADKDR